MPKVIQQIPILRCLLAFTLGILVSDFVPSWGLYVALMLLVVALIFCSATARRPAFMKQLYCGISLFVACFAFGAVYTQMSSTSLLKVRGKCQISGHIVDILHADKAECSFVVEADTLIANKRQYLGHRGVLKAHGNYTLLRIGDQIKTSGRISTLHTEAFSFDRAAYLASNHYEFEASTDSVIATSKNVSSLSSRLAQIRLWIIHRLEMCGISAPNLDLIQAILLGDKSHLDDGIKQAFKDCGIMHLLAVSGMHVGIIYGILCFVCFSLIRLKRSLTVYIAIIVGLWFYALLAGLSPSVFRATIMMSMMSISELGNSRYSVYNALAVSLFIILMIDPTSLYSIGLWLSFSAVTGIVTFYPILIRQLSSRYWVVNFFLDILIVSFVAQMSTMPISLYSFHTFPNLFLLNNIVVSLLSVPLLSASLLTLALSAIPYAGAFVGWVTNMGFSFLADYARMVSSWSFAATYDIPMSGLETALLIAIIVALGWAVAQRKRVYWYILYICMGLFCATAMATEAYHSFSTRVGTFNCNGNQSVVVCSKGRAIFYVHDPSSARVGRSIDNIRFRWRIKEYEVRPLTQGMVFVLGRYRLFAGGVRSNDYTRDNQHYDICALVDSEIPTGNFDFDHYVVQDGHEWYSEWLTTSSANGRKISEDKQVWNDCLPRWISEWLDE